MGTQSSSRGPHAVHARSDHGVKVVCRQGVKGSVGSQEDFTIGSLRATIAQVVQERLTHLIGQRIDDLLSTFARPESNAALAPLNIL